VVEANAATFVAQVLELERLAFPTLPALSTEWFATQPSRLLTQFTDPELWVFPPTAAGAATPSFSDFRAAIAGFVSICRRARPYSCSEGQVREFFCAPCCTSPAFPATS